MSDELELSPLTGETEPVGTSPTPAPDCLKTAAPPPADTHSEPPHEPPAQPNASVLEELLAREDYARALRERIDKESGERVEQARAEALRRRDARDCRRVREHWDELLRQGEEFARRREDFDLSRELNNPLFLRLTAPEVGLSVEEAYLTAHRERLDMLRQQELKAAAAAAVRSGSLRPKENRGAASPKPCRAADRSKAEREALKRRIYAAAARGEKVYL